MSKLYGIIGLILVLSGIIGGILYAGYQRAQVVTNAASMQTLDALGLNTDQLPPPEIRATGLRFKPVDLDADGISTVESITAVASPIIAIDGLLDAIVIQKLEIIGSWKDGQLSFSGLKKLRVPDWQALATRRFVIPEGRVSVLTPQMGGLTFEGDVQARRIGSRIEIFANATSRQKGFSLAAKMTSTVNEQGLWQGNIQIERGRMVLEQPAVQLTRVSGAIDFSIDHANALAPHAINATFQIGGLRLWGANFQNGALSLSEGEHGYALHLTAQSKGDDPMELSLTLEGNTLSGIVFAPDTQTLKDYAQRHKDLLSDDQLKQINALPDTERIQIGFAAPFDGDGRKVYRIKSADGSIDEKGKL